MSRQYVVSSSSLISTGGAGGGGTYPGSMLQLNVGPLASDSTTLHGTALNFCAAPGLKFTQPMLGRGIQCTVRTDAWYFHWPNGSAAEFAWNFFMTPVLHISSITLYNSRQLAVLHTAFSTT